ncbi:dipeptide/oligopeptide/nickel ABC transporter permease/ATP-binding protein [Catenulispora sp. NL8]|uniref:Dipeptide/oligopeptide/nickel ABC transporter permease/ATP-binding protein n=1 Tax=Catenulispora pinistramenti TaxID=2705254 RepID=A0ABS5KQX4_9ACTN|nr:dipeptide/oligopeptide/nickel ABC transporter permease/ATP-binding protein [Catenulispora pinistramenti]MBS2548409.1 dipeptide/oligopeptide/nickel ABC transporter permease/ATP-binding protein [Catenulispora pinistramenti]
MAATTVRGVVSAEPPESFARRLRQSLRTPIGAAALAAALLLAALAVAGPVVFGDQASKIDTSAMNQGVSGAHLLGTDSLGRDIAARVIVATRLTLRLGLSATAIGLVGGLLLGLAPSVLGRRAGRAVTGVVGVLVAFPGLLFVLFLATIFGIGSTGAVLAIGLALVPTLARLIQNLATSVAGSDYVATARILGVGRFRIVVRHVLPNIVEPVVLFAAQAATGSLIAFAGLSFLGLGVQSPDYDWGRLLNEGLSRIYVNPASALAPGVAVVLAGLVFALLGEAVAQTGGRRTAARAVPAARTPVAMNADGGLAQTPADVDGDALAQLTHLRVSFPGGRTAVRDVSLSVAAGEAVGLVGESGSGKSLTALALAHLVPYPGHVQGVVRFDGHDLLADPRSGRRLGAELAMVFQDPMTSLNPALRVGRQLAEVSEVHLGQSRKAALARAVDRLAAVGIPDPERRARQRPHEYSGGMRQRAFIGMGLMAEPRLIIADEPTTALDVTVQKQVLELLGRVRADSGAALLLISHDLGVVAEVCDRVLVMYAGRVVEELPVSRLFQGAAHPYTRALIGAIPTMTTDLDRELATIPGRPPEPGEEISGCAFATRCAFARDRCRGELPVLAPAAGGAGHRVACWYPRAGDGGTVTDDTDTDDTDTGITRAESEAVA